MLKWENKKNKVAMAIFIDKICGCNVTEFKGFSIAIPDKNYSELVGHQPIIIAHQPPLLVGLLKVMF